MSGELTLLRCQTCGGEVVLLTAGERQCLYCGNVYFLLAADLVPLGESRIVTCEPVPKVGYYSVDPWWIVSGLGKLEWIPVSR